MARSKNYQLLKIIANAATNLENIFRKQTCLISQTCKIKCFCFPQPPSRPLVAAAAAAAAAATVVLAAAETAAAGAAVAATAAAASNLFCTAI